VQFKFENTTKNKQFNYKYMNTLQTIYNKLSDKTELAKHEVELGLLDALKKDSDKVTTQIGFVNKDISEVKKAISLIGMIKGDLPSTDKLANDLLNAVITFENKARDLGIDVPKEVINYGNVARELIKSNNELKKYITQF